MNKRHFVHGFWLLVWACCLQTCRPVPQKVRTADTHPVQALDFEYLKISTTISYRDQSQHSGTAYVKFRIKKDCLIWFSVLMPWGMEGLRGIITPTGITLLNRRQKVHYTYDYTALRALWPGPWDYALLQSLLLGELAHTTHNATHNATRKIAQNGVIQQHKAAWKLTHFIHPTLKKVEKLVATAMQGSFVATYKEFKPCQGGHLFERATIHWYYHTTPTQPAMTVTLRGTQAQGSKKPLHFPFSIPEWYEKQ